VFNDCCDLCHRVDDSKREIEPCDEMTKRCKGGTEIEFAQANISNARFLLTAKESRDAMEEELADIQTRIQSEEEELDALRLRVLGRLKETWKALDNITEFQPGRWNISAWRCSARASLKPPGTRRSPLLKRK